jgi:hypothetical protein
MSKRIFISLLIMILSVSAITASDFMTRISTHKLKMNVRVNNYDYLLYNKLTNTYSEEIIHIGDTSTLDLKTRFAKWKVEVSYRAVGDTVDALDAFVTFRLVSGEERDASVAVELTFDEWSTQNYVLMPAAVYNGNRYHSRRIAYSPKLYDPRDIGVSKPMIISDVPRLNILEGPSFIQERSGGMSFPAVGFHAPLSKQGLLLITQQDNKWGDYGINVEETRLIDSTQRASISLMSPLVRERYKYEIANNMVASPDKPVTFKAGDEVKFKFRLYLFESDRIQNLFDKCFEARYDLTPLSTPHLLFPFTECYETIERKFNAQNFVTPWGYYSVGLGENFLQDWQIGWTGGMITTYPLLFSTNNQTIQNVISNFDWLFPNGIAPAGFFYDSGEKGNQWYGGDIRRSYTKDWHLIRKSGDALYYIMKQFDLMKKKNYTVKETWEKGTLKVANTLMQIFQLNGQFGNFVDSNTGEIRVGGSTSGAIIPGALVLASKYYNRNEFLQVAEKSAQQMYDDYISKGISCGGPGDAMQNPDSESWYAMLESFCLLYETTGKEKWLNYAKETAAQFSTWVMSYDYKFPESSLFGQTNMRSRGAVFANTQNRHGAPGICTHSGLALLRLYRATNEQKYLVMLKEITQSIPQYMSHSTRKIADMPSGWINERVNTTDWLGEIGEIFYGSTWSETAMLLTTVEIPSVYIDLDKKVCFSFDNLISEIISIDEKKVKIKITNPTKFLSEATIIAETAADKTIGWTESKLFQQKKYRFNPQETRVITITIPQN